MPRVFFAMHCRFCFAFSELANKAERMYKQFLFFFRFFCFSEKLHENGFEWLWWKSPTSSCNCSQLPVNRLVAVQRCAALASVGPACRQCELIMRVSVPATPTDAKHFNCSFHLRTYLEWPSYSMTLAWRRPASARVSYESMQAIRQSDTQPPANPGSSRRVWATAIIKSTIHSGNQGVQRWRDTRGWEA